MPDESRVFDVSKPSRVSPPATSKPVIVGHHPMSDPMVKEEVQDTTKIPVTVAPISVGQAMREHEDSSHTDAPNYIDRHTEADDPDAPALFSEPPETDAPPADPMPDTESVGAGPFTDAEPVTADDPVIPDSPLPEPAPPEQPHIEGLHFAQPPQRSGRAKYALIGLLILIIAAYLAIDSGLINTGFKLPFHIFKQKQPVATNSTQQQTKPPAANGPVIPNGFKEYKISGTSITFAAPISWGDPSSATDPGYSKRAASGQPDGTYAYIVSFATNKDIQIAVTSSKYLPAKRTALYYDYLQWCTGTNDNQIYESVLNFTTANKVDTPSTITCNQGPVANVTKLNSSTIVQAKATDPTNKVIGDIYTKNINDPSLVAFRVKDAAMTNGSDIKQLLSTVQVTGSSSSSSSQSSSSSSSNSSSANQ